MPSGKEEFKLQVTFWLTEFADASTETCMDSLILVLWVETGRYLRVTVDKRPIWKSHIAR
jgi:hypothetical protein